MSNILDISEFTKKKIATICKLNVRKNFFFFFFFNFFSIPLQSNPLFGIEKVLWDWYFWNSVFVNLIIKWDVFDTIIFRIFRLNNWRIDFKTMHRMISRKVSKSCMDFAIDTYEWELPGFAFSFLEGVT